MSVARPSSALALQQVVALLWKDLMVEWRTKELFSGMGLFAMVVLVVFNFALDLRQELARTLGPGVLWAAVLLAGLLGLGRSFALERDRGTLEGLLLIPMDRSLLYLGKTAALFLFMLLVEAVTVAVFLALFDVPLDLLAFLPLAVLSTFGLAIVGTLFAAMAVHTRAREVMLPLLLLPILVPVVIAAVQGTVAIVHGEPPGTALALLVAFDALFLGLASFLFDFVVEDS
jgi:heme exporter protein B